MAVIQPLQLFFSPVYIQQQNYINNTFEIQK